MARENVTDFAATTLNINVSAVFTGNITVTTGGGAKFPTVSALPTISVPASLPFTPRNFVVSIDSELILISGRVTDTFTIPTGGRGYGGTTAVSHSSGALVTLAITAEAMNRLWASLPDTYRMDVPPYDLNLGATAPSAWDDEFDFQQSKWTAIPLPVSLGGSDSGAYMDFGQTYNSNFLFQRNPSSTTIYWIYQAFSPPAGPFSITMKLSHNFSTNFSASGKGEVSLHVMDGTIPTSFSNAVRIDHCLESAAISGLSYGAAQTYIIDEVRAFVFNSGTASTISSGYLMRGMPYMRLHYDGTSVWQCQVGDGYTWSSFGSVTKTFTINTLAIRFYGSVAGATTGEVALIDWIRVGSV